jgi:hypothetical protein
MTTRDQQAVPFAYGIGVGDAEHTACFAVDVAGLHVAEAEGPLVLVRPAALAAAPGCGGGCSGRSRRLLNKQTSHLFAALLAEGVEALAAELQQRVALGVAQLIAADQAVGAVAVGGDAIAGEHLAHHALPRIRRATSCAGAGLWRPSSSRNING